MSSPTRTGGVIDSEGNFFGIVNVVDLLVVLLVLAVVGGAGLALAVGDDSSSTSTEQVETAFVTLDLGTQPTYLAAAISEGDSFSPTERSNLTVTAVHLAPVGNRTHVVVGASVQGPASEGRVQYSGQPLRLSRSLTISTPTYNVTGQISDIGSEPTPDGNTTTVVVSDRLSPGEAEAITAGDEITVGGRTVATVTDVVVIPTVEEHTQTVRVEAQLSTYTRRGSPHFGETRVTAGQALSLSTDAYSVDGRIERVGTGLNRAGRTNRTVRLAATGVPEAVATVVRPGLTERSGGRTTAYVTGVDVTPSPVVVATANGTVVTGDHPTRRDLTLTTELRVTEAATGPQFRGDRLQYGSTVVLDLGTVTLETTVVELES